MNHEAISQIGITHAFTVQAQQTAAAVYARLPSLRNRHLHAVLSSAELLAQMEAACIEALQPLLRWPQERVLGAAMQIDHLRPADPGQQVVVSGCVLGLGDRSVVFHLRAHVEGSPIAEGSLSFVVVDGSWPRARARPTPQLETSAA